MIASIRQSARNRRIIRFSPTPVRPPTSQQLRSIWERAFHGTCGQRRTGLDPGVSDLPPRQSKRAAAPAITALGKMLAASDPYLLLLDRRPPARDELAVQHEGPTTDLGVGIGEQRLQSLLALPETGSVRGVDIRCDGLQRGGGGVDSSMRRPTHH